MHVGRMERSTDSLSQRKKYFKSDFSLSFEYALGKLWPTFDYGRDKDTFESREESKQGTWAILSITKYI